MWEGFAAAVMVGCDTEPDVWLYLRHLPSEHLSNREEVCCENTTELVPHLSQTERGTHMARTPLTSDVAVPRASMLVET